MTRVTMLRPAQNHRHFNRLQLAKPQQHPPIFSKMGRDKTPKSLVFLRLKGDKQQKSSVFTRIKIGGQIRKLIARAGHELCVQLLGEVNELQSSIPSRMERISALDIKTDGPLKVKRCTPVITSYEASSNSKEKIKENGQASSHPITVRDANDLNAETGTAKAL